MNRNFREKERKKGNSFSLGLMCVDAIEITLSTGHSLLSFQNTISILMCDGKLVRTLLTSYYDKI